MTFGGFSFQSLPRGGSFFNNPALNAFGPLQAGGTRFLANPTFFSYLLPAGTTVSSGPISVTGRGQPFIIYDLLGIPVTNPNSPPVLDINTVPALTGGRLTPQAALEHPERVLPQSGRVPAVLLHPAGVVRSDHAAGTAGVQVGDGERAGADGPDASRSRSRRLT